MQGIIVPHLNTREAAEAVARAALGHVREGEICADHLLTRIEGKVGNSYGVGLSTASTLERMTRCTVPLLYLARKLFFPCTSALF